MSRRRSPRHLARLARNQEYGYAAREGALAAAFTRRMQRRFNWQTDPADAHPIGDLVQASFSSVMAFSEPGDAVLLQLPSYPPFMAAIKDTGRRLIANPMRDNGTRWVLDLASYEAAPDPRARVLIFCHPQNPTGRAYSRAELEQVAAFAIRHDLIVVSDEIHADIVYPGNTHIPLASLLSGDRRAHHHHHLGDQELQHSRSALRRDAFRRARTEGALLRSASTSRLLGSPGVTGVDATIAAWDDGQPWLDEILAQLRANRDWLAQTIGAELPGVTMRLPEATYLAWLDCSRTETAVPRWPVLPRSRPRWPELRRDLRPARTPISRASTSQRRRRCCGKSSAAWPRRCAESRPAPVHAAGSP